MLMKMKYLIFSYIVDSIDENIIEFTIEFTIKQNRRTT